LFTSDGNHEESRLNDPIKIIMTKDNNDEGYWEWYIEKRKDDNL